MIWVVGVALVMGGSVALLVRRERRRMDDGPEGQRIESEARKGVWEARAKGRTLRSFASGAGVSTLRNRDPPR